MLLQGVYIPRVFCKLRVFFVSAKEEKRERKRGLRSNQSSNSSRPKSSSFPNPECSPRLCLRTSCIPTDGAPGNWDNCSRAVILSPLAQFRL